VEAVVAVAVVAVVAVAVAVVAVAVAVVVAVAVTVAVAVAVAVVAVVIAIKKVLVGMVAAVLAVLGAASCVWWLRMHATMLIRRSNWQPMQSGGLLWWPRSNVSW
jgi:hypothetical protein